MSWAGGTRNEGGNVRMKTADGAEARPDGGQVRAALSGQVWCDGEFRDRRGRSLVSIP